MQARNPRANRKGVNRFSRIPQANIQRSVFQRNHSYKTTFQAYNIVPILIDEVYPGDSFNVKLTSVARLITPIAPVMDSLYLDFFFFFIPNRIVWDNWKYFMGEEEQPGVPHNHTVPLVTPPAGGFQPGSLADFFGIPLGVENIEVNALPFRAYNLCYQEWFKDQNLDLYRPLSKDDGPDDADDYGMLLRYKRHDYFTSALPWPQKGQATNLPISGTAPVTGIAKQINQTFSPTGTTGWETGATASRVLGPASTIDVTDPNGTFAIEEDPDNPGFPNVWAQLDEAIGPTVNEWREAFQLQKMLERDARGGTRYVEILQSHFNVTDPAHAVLQRPEYIGGGSTPIIVDAVAQTTPSNIVPDVTPQGNLAGVGYSFSSGVGFNKSFTEHGLVLGVMSCRQDLTYQRGLNKMFSRQTRYDYYFPSLAHLGEQAILSKELWADGTAADESVFGYQERWAELRYKPSIVTNAMRSTHPLSLDIWHLAQDFETRPVLNNSFLRENPPIARISAVQDQDHFKFDGFFEMSCARPLPMYSVPGLIDHF